MEMTRRRARAARRGAARRPLPRRVRRGRRARPRRGRQRSPTSASTRSSTAARRARASSRTRARIDRRPCTAAWASSPTSSTSGSSSELEGRNAIGHVRYSTAGGSSLAQRAAVLRHHRRAVRSRSRTTATSSNACAIRRELEGRGAIFSTTADSEVIVHLLARSREQLPEERLIDALSRVKGAFSLRHADRTTR